MAMEQFNNLMQWLASAYRTTLTNETIMLYYAKLRNEKYDRVRLAFNNIIDKSKYFPSIAEIKAELEEVPHETLLINTNLRWLGSKMPEETPSHEEIETMLSEVMIEQKKLGLRKD